MVRDDKHLNEIRITLDQIWEMHDEAQNAGNKVLADDFATRAFQLLEQLPENSVFLSTKH